MRVGRRSVGGVAVFLGVVAMTGPRADAEVKSKEITYQVGEGTYRGYLAWDDSVEGARPGVLLVHEWWGLNDYARRRANQLAELGYVAFACDMYGEGKTTEHPQEAGQMASAVRQNVDEWRRRAGRALEVLTSQPQCDSDHLAAIGYCFGGSTALQLAYTGADLDAVVTFHAALPVPSQEEAERITARILVNHGADDAFIPQETIRQFKAALDEADVNYEFVSYPGAVHSFTVKEADAKNVDGLKYNAEADRKSWAAMRELFSETLK